MEKNSSAPGANTPKNRDPIGRSILALAIPAFGSLVAEPLFIMIDSAIIGHLGTDELAGLTLASTVLLTIVGLFIFLAYATTATVSRTLGAGDRLTALTRGVDGIWTALFLGVITAALCWVLAPTIINLFGGEPAIAGYAVTYLRWSLPGLPGMLVVYAATGVLRGLLDTRTPLVVAGIGAAVNAGLNLLFVYPVGMGIAGSGLGTALTQVGMAIALTAVVLHHISVARTDQDVISLRPHRAGMFRSMREGFPLFVRTLSLRASILLTVLVATSLGTVALAAHQVVNSIWNFTAYGLDALAIAAQVLVGNALGSGDVDRTRDLVRRTTRWGIVFGAIIGVVLLAVGSFLAPLFTSDPAVRTDIRAALLVVAFALPLSGYVFVLDGILMGAGDGKYLAKAGIVTLAVYVVALGILNLTHPTGTMGLVWLWITMAGVYMGARGVANGLRASGTKWMVTGA